jgi:DNA (cytosine-5)-methyltransferase 1
MIVPKSKQAQRRVPKQLRAIDLFSGCGGLTLGLKQAGFKVIGAVENDALSVESYKRNHRKTVVWQQDLRKLRVSVVRRVLKLRKGELNVLAGCPPCQGFSTLVTNNGCYGFDDPRNDLIYEFLRFVRGLMPQVVMMENVPGLAQTTRFRRFCKRLEDLGYVCKFKVLNAAEFGVPQRRKRLVLLAGRGKEIAFARTARVRYTVRDAFHHLSTEGAKSDPLRDTRSKRTEKVQRLIEKIPKNGGSRGDIRGLPQLQCHKDFDGFYDIYGRLSWNDIAPTITSGCINPSRGRFLHPNKDRAITLREAALLQTFPSTYQISLRRGRYQAAALIGNAFPPEFARRQATMIKRQLISNRGG